MNDDCIILEKDSCLLRTANAVIDVCSSPLLFHDNFNNQATDLHEWIEVGDALWSNQDGILEGKWKKGGKLKHGQIFSRRKFEGDILMEFEASTVAPSDHDIIWWWSAKLNPEEDNWEHGYLGALGGWWTNQAGIEKIEKGEACMAKTPLFRLEAGKKYKIYCGIIGQDLFLFANNKLILEFCDPDPLIKKGSGRIGFGVYKSHIKISKLRVYKPEWKQIEASY